MIFLGTIIGLILGTYAHEFGHLIAAKLNSWPVQKLTFGHGRQLFTFKLGQMEIEFRLIPFGGRVKVSPILQERKLHLLIFHSAGIAANLLLLVIFLVFLKTFDESPAYRNLCIGLSFAQIWLTILNLWPRKILVNGSLIGSDGFNIRNIVSGRHDEELAALPKSLENFLKPYAQDSNANYTLSPYSFVLLQLVHDYDYLYLSQKIQRTEELYLEEQRKGRTTTQEELWLLDALMTNMLLQDVIDNLSRLEELSTRAITIGRYSAAIRQTCSGVFVELNRHRDAKKLLISAMPEPDEKFASTMCSIYLARVEHALGNLAAAEQLAEKAHLLSKEDSNPQNFDSLLRRMDTELSPRPSG
jgi:hypothetical protein